MTDLTPKQKAFADFYIKTGNATDAARSAGYSEKTAGTIGAENLKKPQISAYIGAQLAEMERARVADASEVMAFYTAVLRGEIKDQFDLEASLSDRISAGRELMRRYNAVKTVDDRVDRVAEIMKKLDEEAQHAVPDE